MKQLSSSQIRQMFLDFFKSKQHTIIPGASLIPVDDPSLLWVNSGVATMKDYFNGTVVPKNPRMTSSQRSIRTNDIENVGRTARHHTLFEMLGNFSVGDYFKKDAIAWAWELLTSDEWFGFAKDKLFITVYPKDTEAKEHWLKMGVASDHILEAEDNFWDIGEGPSGPDTEIFYDRGEAYNNLKEDDPENYPGGENERYLEIWNLVFSQFNHEPDGSYKPLPRKNIDTGMGLERVAAVFQNAKTNFETDLFMPMIQVAEKLSGKKYGTDAKLDVAFKVIADHSRAITFAISDGALPSNEGRGYVIRRLIRRAVVNGQKLGIDGAFLDQLVSVVGETMKDHYPDVLENSDYIAGIVRSEEDRFNETLTDGLALLNDLIRETKHGKQTAIDGAEAFKLYDTFGFPVELTREYAKEEGIEVDEAGFEVEMQKQRDRARNARKDDNAMGLQKDLLIDVKTPSEYVGYTQLTVTGAEVKDVIADQALVDEAQDGYAQVIFDKTPFYAEMGGQVADQGVITDANGQLVAKVEDVQHAPNGQNLHTLKLTQPIAKGDRLTLTVDEHFHSKVEKNHSATHLLDQALREVFGEHTQQAGSLVEPNYLRFDFTHFGQVTNEDLTKVEAIVNEKIFAELSVKTVETDPETGKQMGAIALFSEKYGDRVRVVSIGDFSIEFCGGTHVKNTNEIGLFKIKSETGIGAGTRRIEAVTAGEAYEYMNGRNTLLKEVATTLKTTQATDVPARVSQLQAQVKELNNQVSALETKLAGEQAGEIFDKVDTIGGIRLISGIAQVSSMDQLRGLADTWRQKNLSDVLVLGAPVNGKANLLVAANDQAMESGIKAGDLIKAIAPKVQGGGGGRPNLAQAGGKDPAGLPDAIQAAGEWLVNR